MSDQASDIPIRVVLRDVSKDDLSAFFAHQLDADANRMAAFTSADPSDENAFSSHWGRIMNDPSITKRSVLVDGIVAGHIMVYPQSSQLEVTYWIGKRYWGQGVATTALLELLKEVETRPLFARAAKDNFGSLRVLQKCGFVMVGEDEGFAEGRGEMVEELVLRLDVSELNL